MILNFLKKLSFRKILNIILINFSFFYTKITKKILILGYPIGLSIEPNNFCNLQCPECPTGKNQLTKQRKNIDFEMYKKIIDETYLYLSHLLLYFQGEPYLYPNFFKLIQYSNEKNIYTKTSTNGHFLNSENAKKTVSSGLDELIISLDGITQETYEKYRKGGDLSKVLEGIKNIVFWKEKLHSKTPYLILQVLVFKTNEHQILDIKKLSKKLKVNKLDFKTAQFYDFEKGNDLMPETAKYNRYYKNNKGKFLIKNKLKNHCYLLWTSSVITCDLFVLPCCFDKNANFKMGNLETTKFKDIWKNKSYQNFRKKVLFSRKNISICKNCTEGLMTKYKS